MAAASMTVSRRTFRQAYASKLWLAIKWSLTTIGSGENGAMEGDVLSALAPVKTLCRSPHKDRMVGSTTQPPHRTPNAQRLCAFLATDSNRPFAVSSATAALRVWSATPRTAMLPMWYAVRCPMRSSCRRIAELAGIGGGRNESGKGQVRVRLT